MQPPSDANPNVDRKTALTAESIESDAWADFFAAAPPEVVASYATEVERSGSARLLICPGLPDTILNRVLGLGLAAPATEAGVYAVVEAYRRAGSAKFAIATSPLAEPVALPSWLKALGLQRAGGEAKLVRGAEPVLAVPTDLQVGPVDVDRATMFGQVAVDVFGLPVGMVPWIGAIVGQPSWFAYSATDAGETVAVGALYVKDGVAWLGFDATRASHRRRGAQSAIIARRIQDAASLGCRLLAAETGEDTELSPNSSFRNFRRLGFNLAYVRSNFEPSGE